MKQIKSDTLKIILSFLLITKGFTAKAQAWKSEERVNILFGISQMLVSGFNVEGNFIYHRFIFDYSHGVSLDFSGNTVTPELRAEGLAVHMPWTTGFGLGYRITDWINVRLEPKFHKFEFYYDGDPQISETRIYSYNTFSLGIGVYGAWLPFKHKNNFLKGIMISPSIRYWPTVSSTRDPNFTYCNKNTMQMEHIPALDPGVGFKPIVYNISIGYSFLL
jgi:hypothetical protein